MRRGTTPTITVTVDTDLTDWSLYLAIAQGGTMLVLESDRLDVSVSEGVTSLAFTLTQEETLAFDARPVELQVRAAHNGTAIATGIKAVPVSRILQGGVIDG